MTLPRSLAQADLDAWIARLESEREWSERLRALARLFRLRASDLVLLIGAPEDFPRASRGAPHVQGYLVSVGRVTDVPHVLPNATRASMTDAERIAHPHHAHALIFVAPIVEVVRFRVPE